MKLPIADYVLLGFLSHSGKLLLMVLPKGMVSLVCILIIQTCFYPLWDADDVLTALDSGVLEANFIEPAHDKQDFERSSLFFKLETKLKQMVMDYWYFLCCNFRCLTESIIYLFVLLCKFVGHMFSSLLIKQNRHHS